MEISPLVGLYDYIVLGGMARGIFLNPRIEKTRVSGGLAPVRQKQEK
jgi:hypothetical protein